MHERDEAVLGLVQSGVPGYCGWVEAVSGEVKVTLSKLVQSIWRCVTLRRN